MSLTPGFALHFLWTQLRPLPPVPDVDLSGRTAIVTGASGGLGMEAARHFAKMGCARVVLGCRNVEKGEAAKADIDALLGRRGNAATVEVWQLDMGSFESVKAFCRRADALDRVDIVVANAGVAIGTFVEQEGYESTITINVISTMLMALLLLPTLRRTARLFNTLPHLSFVSSDAHIFVTFKERSEPHIFSAYKSNETVPFDRYNVSKLLLTMVAKQLGQELDASDKGRSVVTNTLNPGFCGSDLYRHAPFPMSLIVRLGLLMLGRSLEMGSRTLVAAAVSGEDMHGKYMDACKPWPESAYVRSEEGQKMQKKVYGELMGILEEIEPGVTKNI